MINHSSSLIFHDSRLVFMTFQCNDEDDDDDDDADDYVWPGVYDGCICFAGLSNPQGGLPTTSHLSLS